MRVLVRKGQEGSGEHQQAGAEVKLAAAHALGHALHNLLQHFLFGAQLAVAENGNGHMAVSLFRHVGGKFFHGHPAGISFGLGMAHHHLKVAQGSIGILVGHGADAAQQHHRGENHSQQFLHENIPPHSLLRGMSRADLYT